MKRHPLCPLFLVAVIILTACGGGSSAPATEHLVTISWSANREAAVNRTGGGYRVNISGKAPVEVPYTSGSLAPTSATTTLFTGTYDVYVVAYSAIDPLGTGSSGSTSPVTKIVVVIP